MKKKFVVTVLALAFILSLGTSAFIPAASAAEAVTINVYNWGLYISDGSDGMLDVNKAFTEATGIEVNYSTYDSNETLYSKLKTGGSSYDIIIPSDYMVGRLAEEGYLQKLNFDNIPNYQYVDEDFKNQTYDPNNEYSVPYTWGTVGLIYNTKFVDNADSWSALWNEDYSGKVLMFDNPRDAFGISELLLGYDLNTSDKTELQAAADKLKELHPHVQSYVMDQVYSAMQNEEAWLAPYYAGDFVQMAPGNENLAFSFPEEGFNLFIDAICIPTCSENKEAAEAYINFLCDPEVSAENLSYIGYGTPISAAKEFMDAETVASEVTYPDSQTLSRGSAFLSLDEDTLQLMDSLWFEVKASNSSGSWWIYAVIAVVVIAAVALILVVRKQKRKKRRQRRSAEQE